MIRRCGECKAERTDVDYQRPPKMARKYGQTRLCQRCAIKAVRIESKLR